MKHYDVEGYDAPLLLSDEHAEVLGVAEHEVPVAAPSSRASKQEWVDYAIGQGADPALVATWTRSDIIDTYGA